MDQKTHIHPYFYTPYWVLITMHHRNGYTYCVASCWCFPTLVRYSRKAFLSFLISALVRGVVQGSRGWLCNAMSKTLVGHRLQRATSMLFFYAAFFRANFVRCMHVGVAVAIALSSGARTAVLFRECPSCREKW